MQQMFCDMIPYDIIYDSKKVLDLKVGGGFGFDVGFAPTLQ